jgi:glutathione S-transferase
MAPNVRRGQGPPDEPSVLADERRFEEWRNRAAPGCVAPLTSVTPSHRSRARRLAAPRICEDARAMKFVSLEEARAATGLKLVVAASLPSPWSEAAKGLLHIKGLEASLVRFSSGDKAVREWMGWHNVPVLLAPGEPVRTHWSEILETAERLGAGVGRPSLVPADEDDRVRLFGLTHELLGENGLVWSSRLLVIHRGLVTEGREGFALRVAQYLAPKYGYAPGQVDAAQARVRSLFDRFARLLEGKTYALGGALSGLDVYLATAIAPLAPMSEEHCPDTHPRVRHAFATASPELSSAIPPVLVAHRDRIYAEHLELPVRL